MENTTRNELLNQIMDAVRTCGEIILHADRGRSCIDEKAGHANFVTAYDKKYSRSCKGGCSKSCRRQFLSARRRTSTHPLQRATPLLWIRLTARQILSRTTI